MSSTRHHIAQIIGERTLHMSNTKHFAKEVAAYLLESGLTGQLDSLMRDLMAYRAEHGVVEASAVSAHRLSRKDIADIKTILQREYPAAKHFSVDQELVPEVMGGVQLNMPGEQLDLTVRAKVNTFKRLTAGEGA